MVLTIAGGALALVVIGGAGAVVLEALKRTRLTPDGTVSLDGTDPVDAYALAKSNGFDLETYALARMIESECGALGQSAKIGVAWAAMNHASSSGKTISELLLHSTGKGNGFFGRQDQGRYASTSTDPSAASIDIALKVTSGSVIDPTGGADQWDSPWSYKDTATETAAEKAARVAATREAAGKELVILDDVPARKLRFWRDVA